MKTLRPWIAAVLALALCAAGAVRAAQTPAPVPPAGPAPKADVTGEAQAAIQKMLSAYGALKQYQGTFSVVTAVQTDRSKRSSTINGTLKLLRPDKVRVELAQSGLSIAITCDGQQCMEYFSGSDKYLQWKAPSNLDSVLGNPSLGQALSDMARVTLIPFTGEPYKNFMIGVTGARVLPGGADKPIHVQLDVASGVLDFYLDPKTHLVTEAHALPTRMIEALKAQQPGTGDLKITYDMKQEMAPADTPIPDDAFSVTPPEGAAEATTPKDLFEAPALKEMVDFRLPTLTEGKSERLADHKGKVILLDFWATWCPPCRAELPILQDINREFADKGLVFLAVNLMEDRQKVADFLKEQKLDIPVVLDSDGAVGTAYQADALPTLYLIGKDGKVLEHKVGFDADNEDKARADLEKAIKDALSAPAPADAGS